MDEAKFEVNIFNYISNKWKYKNKKLDNNNRK